MLLLTCIDFRVLKHAVELHEIQKVSTIDTSPWPGLLHWGSARDLRAAPREHLRSGSSDSKLIHTTPPGRAQHSESSRSTYR